MNEYPKYPVGRGWWSLLDEYLPKLEKMGVQLERTPYEKYGTLRLAVNNEPLEVSLLLEELEEKSRRTCEVCGKTAEEKTLANGWVKTLCDDDFQIRNEQLKSTVAK